MVFFDQSKNNKIVMHPEYENETAKVKPEESQLQCISIFLYLSALVGISMGFASIESSVFAVVLFEVCCEKGLLSENDKKMLRIMFSEF